MAETLLEEAKRCPKCQQPGAENGSKPAAERHMGRLQMFKCLNNRCSRFEGIWVVQIRPDGTIPTPSENREKNFPVIEGMSTKERTARARAQIDALNETSMDRS
jgi:hypothetical protein